MSDVWDRIAALPAARRAQLLQRLQTRRVPLDVSSAQYDVTILGGGMAGLTLARQIKKACPSTRIVVIEKQEYPVPEAAHRVGESTAEIASRYLRDVLELEEHLQTKQLRKLGLRMFFQTNTNQDIARRIEPGSTISPPLYT